MYGLGVDGLDFVLVVLELGLDEIFGVCFIFFYVLVMLVICNGGYVMLVWYDIILLELISWWIDEVGIVYLWMVICWLIVCEN